MRINARRRPMLLFGLLALTAAVTTAWDLILLLSSGGLLAAGGGLRVKGAKNA